MARSVPGRGGSGGGGGGAEDEEVVALRASLQQARREIERLDEALHGSRAEAEEARRDATRFAMQAVKAPPPPPNATDTREAAATADELERARGDLTQVGRLGS
jgi:hypothetical protein